ncbi:hypothetical protein HPB47_003237 [Ixodes persulcatus]|uniref:Uncharacterized protein n=1 Tax=Ixodes persulcatus TaxID=34615 RepID=A0AC60PK64_IXOPE|nr:hypothetical protein HPB47_003237 [Ixodes persulcatus]
MAAPTFGRPSPASPCRRRHRRWPTAAAMRLCCCRLTRASSSSSFARRRSPGAPRFAALTRLATAERRRWHRAREAALPGARAGATSAHTQAPS